MAVPKIVKTVGLIVGVSYVGLRVIVWATGKMQASTNPTVAKIGATIAGS